MWRFTWGPRGDMISPKISGETLFSRRQRRRSEYKYTQTCTSHHAARCPSKSSTDVCTDASLQRSYLRRHGQAPPCVDSSRDGE